MASVAVGGTLMADTDTTSDEERVVRKQTWREVRRLGNGYAKLYKLAVHAGSSPKRIGAAHVSEQLAYFGRDAWA